MQNLHGWGPKVHLWVRKKTGRSISPVSSPNLGRTLFWLLLYILLSGNQEEIMPLKMIVHTRSKHRNPCAIKVFLLREISVFKYN